MTKMGRPLKGESAAEHIISFRLTDAEYRRLKAYTSANKITVTEVLHQGIELVINKKK